MAGRPLPTVTTPDNFQSLKSRARTSCSRPKGVADPGKRPAIRLIRDAWATLGTGGIGILRSNGTASDEWVLSVVRYMGKRICKPEVEAVRHAAANRESRS